MKLARLSARQKNILSVGLLLAIILLFFWRVPIQGRVLLPLDVLHTYEPWRSEVPGATAIPLWNSWRSDEVRLNYPFFAGVQRTWENGEAPFWNPYHAVGTTGFYKALYPVMALLMFWLPVAQAMSWSIILHTFLAMWFTFLFLRTIGCGRMAGLVGGIVFAFGGYTVMAMPSTTRFPSIIWLPLMFLIFEQWFKGKNWFWVAAGGIVLWLQLLAGALQITLYSLTGLGLYVVYRVFLTWWDTRNPRVIFAPFLFITLMGLIGVALAAFQILPMLELANLGVRNNVEVAQGIIRDVPLNRLARLIVPDIFGNDLDKNAAADFLQHDIYIYFGLLPLFFIWASLFGPQRRLAWGLAGIGGLVLLVIFKVPFVYQLFEMFYPAIKILGFHRALFVTTFSGAVTAGLGLDWLIRERPVAFIKKMVYGGAGVLSLLLITLVSLAYALKYQQRFFWPVPSLEGFQPGPTYLLPTLLFCGLLLGGGLWLLWFWAAAKINFALFGAMSLILIVADLFLAHIDLIPAYPPSMLYPQTPSLAYLQELADKETQPFRIMSVNRLFWGDMSTVFGLEDVQGYDSFLMQRYSRYLDLTNARAEANFRIAAFEAKTSPFLNALNVKYIYAPRYKLTDGDWVSLLRQADQPLVESGHSYAGQPAEWTINGWMQPVLLAPTRSVITYRGFLDKPTQLETALAIDPAEPIETTVLFEVYVQSETSPQPTLLFSRQISQSNQPGWVPVTVDLSVFAGQPVLVSLVTSTVGDVKRNAGWADPLLSDASQVKPLYYGPNSIYLNKNYLPRAWLVHQVTAVAAEDVDGALAVMRQPDFDPAKMAVIEGQLPAAVVTATGAETAAFEDYSPSSSIIRVNLSAPGLLVLSDIYYPGWNVYVDDLLQPLYATNVAMRSVYLPAGEHQVRFVYEPRSFRVGLVISLTTSVLILAAVGVGLWRNRNRSA